MSQGGQGQTPMYGGNYRGGYQAPNYGSRMGAPMMAFNQPQQSNEFRYQPRGGYQAAPQAFNAYNPQPQGAALAAMANQNVMGFPRQPQMSGEFMAQPKGGLMAQGRNMISQAPQDEAPGFMVNQRAAPQQAQAPQQSFEQFAQTLGNSGMTSGQMQDAYQKSLQPAATNFWGNVGPGGTQNPYPQNPNWTPPQWGQQTFGFDPRSMAGKTVSKDLGWYYGQDAIGRTINNQGDAVPTFTPAQDGFNRTNPAWFR